jgi:hypothetical protein
MSSVFAALSLRKGRAMIGTRCEAGMWPLGALVKRLYGTDILNCFCAVSEKQWRFWTLRHKLGPRSLG